MRTLPDSPSLDHLRQQAKDLLQRMRVAQPTATLSDAQTAVAEQHGYRTWPDLKAEVDRHCARVRTTDASVTAAVEAAFDLGKPQAPLLAYERQWAGQAWVLTTDRGRWLARQLFDWFDESAVDADVGLAEAAAAAGIGTPRPVRSPAGRVIERLDGARWRVFDFLAAGPEPSVPTDPKHAAAAGRILAKVHNLGLPAAEAVQPWLTSVRGESAWWNLHAVCQTRSAPWADRLAEVVPSILEACDIVESAETAGDVVLSGCHYPPNAFRLAGPSDLMITGFDHASSIPVRWDLGGTLAAWSGGVGDQLNVSALRALHAGYAEERTVPQPLDIGIFSAALSSSMNWLVSRPPFAPTPAGRIHGDDIHGSRLRRAVMARLQHLGRRSRGDGKPISAPSDLALTSTSSSNGSAVRERRPGSVWLPRRWCSTRPLTSGSRWAPSTAATTPAERDRRTF